MIKGLTFLRPNYYKVSASEWLLNSTSANYLLNDRDYDSHTPLLIEVHANQYTGGGMRAMSRNPDTVKEKADRRKLRQKANKARGSTEPAPTGTGSPQGEGVSGAAASGSQRSAEPAHPPGGKAQSGKVGKGGKSSKGKDKGKGKGKY